MRGDLLASGSKSAQFSVGSSKKGDDIELKNIMSDEDIEKLEKEQKEFLSNLDIKINKYTGNFEPNENQLLIRQSEAELIINGIVVSLDNKNRPSEGVILEVGNKVKYKKGEKIFFAKYSGYVINLNEELLIIDKEDVLGKII